MDLPKYTKKIDANILNELIMLLKKIILIYSY